MNPIIKLKHPRRAQIVASGAEASESKPSAPAEPPKKAKKKFRDVSRRKWFMMNLPRHRLAGVVRAAFGMAGVQLPHVFWWALYMDNPAVGAWKWPIPLMIGIRNDVLVQHRHRHGLWLANYVLRQVVNNRRYLAMLACPGSMRFDLDANAVDEVSAAHREKALIHLAGGLTKPQLRGYMAMAQTQWDEVRRIADQHGHGEREDGDA